MAASRPHSCRSSSRLSRRRRGRAQGPRARGRRRRKELWRVCDQQIENLKRDETRAQSQPSVCLQRLHDPASSFWPAEGRPATNPGTTAFCATYPLQVFCQEKSATLRHRGRRQCREAQLYSLSFGCAPQGVSRGSEQLPPSLFSCPRTHGGQPVCPRQYCLSNCQRGARSCAFPVLSRARVTPWHRPRYAGDWPCGGLVVRASWLSITPRMPGVSISQFFALLCDLPRCAAHGCQSPPCFFKSAMRRP